MTTLEVTDLVKTYTLTLPSGSVLRRATQVPVHAVRGVTLSVRSGEVLAVVGESGCGKSTLAKVIAGQVPQTSGQVVVDGRSLPVRRTRADLATIQLVPQNPFSALNRRRSIGHALEQPLRVHRVAGSVRERRRLVEQMLERVGLSRAYLTARPGEVSGGEVARVVLARALLLGPRILVLDEPTASLDASVKGVIVNLVDEIRTDLDLGVLIISHEIDVVRQISDRAAVMYLGEVVELADASTTLHRPEHPYTRMLLDSLPGAQPRDTPFTVPTGEVGSALRLPTGCSFRPRCPFATEVCFSTPPRTPIATGYAACHHVPLDAMADDEEDHPRADERSSALSTSAPRVTA